MSKHTPGPWSFGRFADAYDQWEVGLPSRYGEGIGCRDDEYMHLSGICKESDARLIAAAPDLLEALKALEEAARQVQCGEMDKQSIDVERRKARAAIAKATGEQP